MHEWQKSQLSLLQQLSGLMGLFFDWFCWNRLKGILFHHSPLAYHLGRRINQPKGTYRQQFNTAKRYRLI